MKPDGTVFTPSGSGSELLDRRRFLWLLALIATSGAALRLLVGWEFSALNGGLNNMMSPAASTDMATYMRLGREIASGTFSGVFYYQPFYYAVFLPVIHFFGGGVAAVAAVQALLGGATVWLAGVSAARLFGRGGGLSAALLTAISTPLLLYSPFHLNETLQAFNLTLWFFLLLIAEEKRGWFYWMLCGLVAGVAVLTRGNALLLTVPVLSWLGWHFIRIRALRRECAVAAGVFILSLAVVELPFVWRNSTLLGRLSGPSTAADAVLALGNTPESPPGGREPGLPAGPMEYPESFHRMMKLSESGVSVPRQMLDWLRREPAAFLELQFRKALLFWDAREIPNNVSLYGEGRHSRILRFLLPGRSGVLLTLALAGLLLMPFRLFGRREFGMIMLYVFIGIYWLSIALFYNLSRFRAPILPLLSVAAGGVWFYAASARLTRQRMLRLAAALLAGVWLCGFAYEFYRNGCEAAVMRVVRPDGTEILSAGGERRIFDNGPFSFGGWRELPVAAGMTVAKRFGVPVSGGILRLKIFSAAPGTLVLDRGRFELSAGENEIFFPVLADEHGEVGFAVREAPAGCSLVVDLQRDYGRTAVNGKIFPGEAVVYLCPTL